MILHPHVTGVVLAGGRARRLGGVNKARLPIGGDGTRTTLSRILEVFDGRFPSCVLVTAGDDDWAGSLPVTRARDRFAGCGPLGGLHAALGALATPFAFVCGCDMPSLSGPLLDLMARRTAPGRLLVPVVRGRPEPLHAIYPASCLPAAERALEDGVRTMLDFFGRVAVDYLPQEEFAGVDGAERSFANINTPQDLETLR